MDTSSLKKKCPRCGTEIEPKRHATAGDQALAGTGAAGGAMIGASIGGPVGAVVGGAIGYFLSKESVLTIENDHSEKQWFKYKCPNCGCSWKEKIHTNDHPDDPTWLGNMGPH